MECIMLQGKDEMHQNEGETYTGYRNNLFVRKWVDEDAGRPFARRNRCGRGAWE